MISTAFFRQAVARNSAVAMLPNSYGFIFGLLPASILGVWLLSDMKLVYRQAFLVFISAVFYGFWGAAFSIILLASIALNFVGARYIIASDGRGRFYRLLTLCGLNIAVLIYFKYTSALLSTGLGNYGWLDIGLPIAISFFTFQQLSYLIDSSRGAGGALKTSFMEYALMVIFFPHLLAGPIVRYSEIIPQFRNENLLKITQSDLAVGLSIFILGLAKKVLLGDFLARIADPIFAACSTGQSPTIGAAWLGSVAYTLQLYFDFSGYSDMAIGLARIFGVKLPINFNSPYKATSLIEVWKRWHMTMTRFFMNYVYAPWVMRELRAGMVTQQNATTNFVRALALPTLCTFVLVGLWHGSGITFLIFGFLHGSAMIAVRLWRTLRLPELPAVVAWFLAVSFFSVTLVLIRAPDVTTAYVFVAAMFGKAGNFVLQIGIIDKVLLVVGIAVALLMPNTAEIFRKFEPVLGVIESKSFSLFARVAWRPTEIWAAVLALLFVVSVLNLFSLKPFIYLQF